MWPEDQDVGGWQFIVEEIAGVELRAIAYTVRGDVVFEMRLYDGEVEAGAGEVRVQPMSMKVL